MHQQPSPFFRVSSECLETIAFIGDNCCCSEGNCIVIWQAHKHAQATDSDSGGYKGPVTSLYLDVSDTVVSSLRGSRIPLVKAPE